MPQVWCDEGHRYDPDEFASCPYCPVLDDVEDDFQDSDTAANWGSPQPNQASDLGPTEPWYKSSDGRTVAWWQASQPGQADEKERGITPVVGWLVAIGGPDLGKSFLLHPEGNTIGRGHENMVMLSDESVARDSHAVLFFDPNTGQTDWDSAYVLRPGDKKGVYAAKNDAGSGDFEGWEVIHAPRSLGAYDVIKIGKTRLLFVPLCNEDFSWEFGDPGDDRLV